MGQMISLLKKRLFALKNDLLSGLTVALALVPEAIAFAFIAGVNPLVGLYATFIVGLMTGIFGGRPGMISGATGALAVVSVSLVSQHGIEYLFAAVILMGLIQMLAGVLQFGKFIRLVPHSVMLGAVNGLAIVIFIAQLAQFKYIGAEGQAEWLPAPELYVMLGLMAAAMAIVYFLPKITKAIPASLAAILSVTLIIKLFAIDTRTVLDMAPIAGVFPPFHLPSVPFTWETLRIIFPYSVILAAVGLTESLITLQLVDEVTETRGQSNKECVAQGLGNLTTGFFGGMGGCAMIGQSMINVNSGGRGRLSSITAATLILIFIIAASPLIEMIPLAALVGVMMMVVISTFEWSSFRILRKIPRTDALIIILVSIVTVRTDLAIGVGTGVVVASLVFAWQKSKQMQAKTYLDEKGIKHYKLEGSLFFGSIQSFNQLFTVDDDPKVILINFKHSRVCDHSAIEALNNMIAKYDHRNKKVIVYNLSPDCASTLKKAEVTYEEG